MDERPFPSHAKAGAIFNDIFSMSSFGFINKYRVIAKKYEMPVNPYGSQMHKFILTKDIWGPKESLLFVIEKDSYILKFASRNSFDYSQILDFIKNEPQFTIVEQNINSIVYQCEYPFVGHVRNIIVTFAILSSQHYEINLIITPI